MTEYKSIKYNFIFNVFLTLSSFIFPLISFPYVARILLPEGIGKVAMATSIIAYFSLLARLGIPMYGIRACAGVRDDRLQLSKLVHELFLINLFMAGVSYILLFITVFSLKRFAEEYYLYLIMSITILLEVLGVEWLYKAMEEYRYITFRSIFFKFLALVATFLFIRTKQDYVIYGGITILAASASNLLNFYNLRHYISFSVFSNYNFKPHIKPILIFFVTACAIVIYTQLNTVILGFMKTNSDVGLYDTAMKIKNVLASIVSSLGAVLLPRMSYYVKQGQFEDFSRTGAKAVHFVCLIAFPLIAFFMLFASNGIHLISGKHFNGAILPMQIILPSVFFIGITNIIGIQILVPLKKEKAVFYSVVGGGIVDLIACLLLIPKFAVIGAAISNLLAELAVFIIQYYFVRKHKDKVDIGNALRQVEYGKIFIAIVIAMAFAIQCRELMRKDFLILLISGSLFFILYGIGLLLLKEKFFIALLVPIRKKL